jgi:enoyl-CoA hydratase/carnithine racemase
MRQPAQVNPGRREGWHRIFDLIARGPIPYVAALHIRVADATAFFALPEGQRGIFVGGGGSARVPRLAGVACMTDMMLTGRVLDAAEGQQRGLSHYVVDTGAGFAHACALAQKIASNAPLSNFAVMQALPRIADLSQSDGLFVESLMAAIAQGDDAAKERVRAFLEKRAGKVEKQA